MRCDAFIKLLRDLLFNAFEAVALEEFKTIYCEIAKESDGNFTIIIKNNGEILGFSTKNAPNRGYGLFCAKQLIDHYKGAIDIRGTDDFTQLTITLPFKEYIPLEAPLLAGREALLREKKPLLTIIKGGRENE